MIIIRFLALKLKFTLQRINFEFDVFARPFCVKMIFFLHFAAGQIQKKSVINKDHV